MKHNLQNTLTAFIISVGLFITSSQVNGQNISTVAGNNSAGYTGDGGQATAAQLNGPASVAVDVAGDLYIADLYNSVIREVNTSGVITTIAGTGVAGFSGDGGQATAAKLFDPTGVSVDTAGNVYIADNQNNRVREISAATGIITTIAGIGTQGYSGDGGTATLAQLDEPYDLTVDNSGNVYFSDYANNRIRKISGKIITTVAGDGVGSYAGDGGAASSAEISGPEGVALDGAGNLYIADEGNNRVRKVSGGIITTVAGNGDGGFSGDNGPATSAELLTPTGVILDAGGSLYIADNRNNRIRKVTTGSINTIGGDGTKGYSGDGGSAIFAELNFPNDVAVDTAGNIYVADFDNNVIRKLTGCGVPLTVTPQDQFVCDGSSITLTVTGGTTYTWSPGTGLSSTSGDSVIANPTITTTYTVASAGTGGCNGIGIDVVNIIPTPNKPTITLNNDSVLTSSATQGNQWYRNDTLLSGATNQSYVAAIGGNYTVEAINPANGCSSTSNAVYASPTGINQLFISRQLTIYPNPASGEIFLNVSSSVADVKDWNLQITDVLGRTVYDRSSLNYNNDIDVSNLSGGMYFITVIDKTARAVFPVVKQN